MLGMKKLISKILILSTFALLFTQNTFAIDFTVIAYAFPSIPCYFINNGIQCKRTHIISLCNGAKVSTGPPKGPAMSVCRVGLSGQALLFLLCKA